MVFSINVFHTRGNMCEAVFCNLVVE